MAYCAKTVSRARYFEKHYGNGLGVKIYLVALGVLEFGVRSATRRREGQSARLRALHLQLCEVTHPGTVQVLK
jgi:hypothetical protein